MSLRDGEESFKDEELFFDDYVIMIPGMIDNLENFIEASKITDPEFTVYPDVIDFHHKINERISNVLNKAGNRITTRFHNQIIILWLNLTDGNQQYQYQYCCSHLSHITMQVTTMEKRCQEVNRKKTCIRTQEFYLCFLKYFRKVYTVP